MKTVLVAGGAGFIGSHLCEFLLNKGYKVHAIDNLSTGTKDNLSQITSSHFQFTEVDITCPLQLDEKYNQIYNLASPASPLDFKKMPIDILKCGSHGIFHLLEKAQQDNSIFLFSSTSEVYGDPIVHPQTESYFGNVNPVGERGCYDEAKRFGEALCMAFQRTHGTQVRIARIFNTYGPRMRKEDGRVIPNFFTQGLKGESLTIFGNGTQTRSLCYISDLCEGLFALMESDVSTPVNLGSSDELSVLDIAKIIRDLTNNKKDFKYLKMPPDDPQKRRADINKAKTKLNWEPEVSLDQGLLATLNYYKSLN